ncbi:MAG: hypothetical protein ACREIC_12440, partial [Limisphaerales bacterium]
SCNRRGCKMIKGIIVLQSSAVVLMAQPTVTVKSLIDEEPRLYLRPPDTPDFARTVAQDRFDYVRQLTALHRYAAVMLNNTDKDVIAYAVSRRGEDTGGQQVRVKGRVEATFLNGIPGDQPELPAHSAHVLIPGPRAAADPRVLQEQLAAFSRFRNLTVTLDAAVFSDGRAVGRDPDNWIPRWKAYLDVGRELAALLAKPDQRVRSGLEEMVRAGVEAGADRIGSEYLAPTYEDAFVAIRTRVARAELAQMDAIGDGEHLQRLRSSARGKQFPRVQRSGAIVPGGPPIR